MPTKRIVQANMVQAIEHSLSEKHNGIGEHPDQWGFGEWLGQNTSVGVSPETFLLLQQQCDTGLNYIDFVS
jgi:hypothetical protein